MTFSNALESLLMIGTTSSPSLTGSVPPVTKQFCTSTTSSALFASGLTARREGERRRAEAEQAGDADVANEIPALHVAHREPPDG